MTAIERPTGSTDRPASATPTADAVARWLRSPTAEIADRWLRGRAARIVPRTGAPASRPDRRQLQALRLAPRVATGLDPSVPAGERWRHHRLVQARPAGPAPQGLVLAVPDRQGNPVRCLYRLAVVDGEVTLLPGIVRVGDLQFRAFGGREAYAPAQVPPLARPAYDAVWLTAHDLQARFDRWRQGDADTSSPGRDAG